MTSEQLPAVPEPTPEPAPPPALVPSERGEWIRGAFQRIVAVALGQVIRDLLDQSADSTALSFQDRALAAMVRPQVPRLQRLLLSRLSNLDPAGLETALAAVVRSMDELLAAAPGEPLPAYVFRYDPATESFVLIPLDG